MDVKDVITQARDVMTVKRVFGDPYELDGVTVIPAARVRGGAGGGESNRGPGERLWHRVRAGCEAGRRPRDPRRQGVMGAGGRRQPGDPSRPRRSRHRSAAGAGGHPATHRHAVARWPPTLAVSWS